MLRTPLRYAIYFALLGLVALVGGCSRKSGEIYDTTANPQNFPEAAVALVDSIQTGTLMGGPAITDAFGRLYTDHSELLDQAAWSEVVTRMGDRFKEIGDSLVTVGIPDYTMAADYYQLASFALPYDPDIQQKSTHFQTWVNASGSPRVDVGPLVDGSTDIHEVLKAMRPFALISTQSYKFLRAYLTEPLKKRLEAAGQLEPSVIESLVPVDQALAAFCGLTTKPPSTVVARFIGPTIDVVACRVMRTGDSAYAAEAYFIPQMDEPRRLSFGLTLLTADSSLIPVELFAPVPRNEWKKGELAAVGREFHFAPKLVGIGLGLVDATEEPSRLVDVEGRDDAAWPLEIEVKPAPDSL